LPTLTLFNVSSTNVGIYQAVISDGTGSITSSVVSLVVFIPPQNLTAHASGAGVTLQLKGTTNYPYVLQSTTNLTRPVVWQSVVTNPADATGNWTFTDTNSSLAPVRYYRATVP